jgi:adenylate kinase
MKLLEQENEILNKEQTELLKEIERLRDEGKKIQRMYLLTILQIINSLSIDSTVVTEADRDKVLLRNAKTKMEQLKRERDTALKQTQSHIQKIQQMDSQMNNVIANLQTALAHNEELERSVEMYIKYVLYNMFQCII